MSPSNPNGSVSAAEASLGEGRSFCYLFERFPSFVQTFVYREAAEMVRQGMNPALVSIREPEDRAKLPEELRLLDVFYLPPEKSLRAEADAMRARREVSSAARRAIRERRSEPDSQRIFEAAWLGPVLKRHRIRHVHAHFGGMAARTAWWLRRLYGIRYSFTGHANDIFCESGCPVTNADLVRDAEFVVTETDFARRWMEEKHPGARGRVFRVFNGIDLSGFPPREQGSEPPKILSVGRYVEKKGFPQLIDACQILRDRGMEFECLIVGGGPMEEQLRERIAVAGLEGTVKLLGALPQSEIRKLFAEAAVFALASVPEQGGGSDNLPTVVAEAMSAGAPVVSTRLAGVPEMIEDGADGLLVEPGDVPALADAIGRLLQNREYASRLAQRGRASAESKFAIERTTGELKRLLVQRAMVRVPAAAIAHDPQIPRPGWWKTLRLAVG